MIRIKKNPTDLEFLNQIQIEKEENNRHVIYFALYKNEVIGDAYYSKSNNWISSIDVENDFQRKGLATFLYNYIENDLGIKLQPSKVLLNDGKKFWQNRLKKKNPTDKEFLSQVKIQKIPTKAYISYEAFYNNKYIAGVDFDPKTKNNLGCLGRS